MDKKVSKKGTKNIFNLFNLKGLKKEEGFKTGSHVRGLQVHTEVLKSHGTTTDDADFS